MPKSLRSSRLALFGLLLVLSQACLGHYTLPADAVPRAGRGGVRIGLVPFVSNPRALDTVTSPGTYTDVILTVVNKEREDLDVSKALQALHDHWNTIDNAKWWNAGLTALTTVAGTIGSNEANTASDKEKKAFTYSTAILGGLTTVLIAVRDDKDIANRIQTCQNVVQQGNKAISDYQNKWLPKALDVPAVGTPERKQFDDDLTKDGQALADSISALLATCH